ncbi:MAG: GEVED domain-containing protein, partial [Chitinophagales bacterium]
MNNWLLKTKFAMLLLAGALLLAWQVNAQYCEINYGYGSGAGDYLDRFVLEDIDNTTGAGSEYNDYTGLSTTLSPGLDYTVTLYNCPSWTEYYAVWVDWNQNEEFEEDENLIGTGATNYVIISPGSNTNIDFTVPVTALPGETRLRVVCAYYPSTPMEACFNYDAGDYGYYYGEVEDYTVFIPASGPYDLALTDILYLSSGCGMGMETISVEIFNVGTDPANDFSVSYQITDPVLGVLPAVTEDYTGGDIASFDDIIFNFATMADFSNIGDYTVNAWITWDLDEFELNNSDDIGLTSIPVVSSFPYVENFEAGSGGWMAGGASSTWELGYPDGPVISGPPPSTPGSLNSWATSLFDYYNLYEDSYVVGPCFDFSSLLQPYVKFDIWWETPDFWDGARLEYSLD